jgi:hypothetical protein
MRQWEIQTCWVNTSLTKWWRICVAVVNALCMCAEFLNYINILYYFCWE